MEKQSVIEKQIPADAKLALEGYLQPGEDMHRNVLFDKLVQYIPNDPSVKVQVFTAEIIPGGFTGYHCHNGATFFLVLQGYFEAHFEDGVGIRAKAGDVYSEPIGKIHRGHNPHSTIPNLCVCFTVVSPDKEFVTNFDKCPW